MQQKKKNQYEEDLIQLSVTVHKLRNGQNFVDPMIENHFVWLIATLFHQKI